MFLLLSGQLEIVDSRRGAEVKLAALGPGDVVGELSFLHNAPRAADVRARDQTSVLQWTRTELRTRLSQSPELSARFYEALAKLAAFRMSDLTATALSGGLGGADSHSRGISTAETEAGKSVQRIKSAFIRSERHFSRDSAASGPLIHALDQLERAVADAMAAFPDPRSRDAATAVFARELHPYLVRSNLAERCIRRSNDVGANAEMIAHVLVNNATGDGDFGVALDRWMLNRPTFSGVRALQAPTIRAASQNLPTKERRILVVNAGTGALVAGLIHALVEYPTQLIILDQSQEALAFLDSGVTYHPNTVTLQTVQENLARFAMGRVELEIPPVDEIVIHGLVEFLPDRIAWSLLATARDLINPGGRLVMSSLGPSADEPLVSRVLNWPTVRREPRRLIRLAEAADWTTEAIEVPDPGLLVIGTMAE